MSDDKNIDNLIKSVLENGREEVPEHIWNGISESLDKAARHKAAILWFKRAGVAAAAAAVIAFGFILRPQDEASLVLEPLDDDKIAVVTEEPHNNDSDDDKIAHIDIATADVPVEKTSVISSTKDKRKQNVNISSEIIQDDKVEQNSTTTNSTKQTTSAEVKTQEEIKAPGNIQEDEWREDDREVRRRKINTSLVISGITGANISDGKSSNLKRMSTALNHKYTHSTVEQTDNDIKYGVPFSVGAGLKINFTPKWALGVGINYSLLTSRFNGKYIKVNEDGSEDFPIRSQIRNTQHYIGIPINAYYNIINKDFINFYTYAGGTVEKCIKNNYEVITPAINHKEAVKNFQFSVNAGIGVEFLLGKYVGIYIDPSLRYYFKNSQPSSIRTSQPLMFGVELGLRFNL